MNLLPTLINRQLFLLAVTFATMLEMIGVSVTNVMLTPLSIYFHTDLKSITLISSIYIICGVTTLSLSSYLCKYLGMRYIFIVLLLIFTASSALASLAFNIEMLIIARGLQGLSGGAILSVSQAALYQEFKGKEMQWPSVVYSIGLMAGPAIGPTLGGYLIDNWSWRSVFTLNIPLGALILVLTWLSFPKNDKVSEFKGFNFWDFIAVTSTVISIQLLCERLSINWHFFYEAIFYLSIIIVGLRWLSQHKNTPDRIIDLLLFKEHDFLKGSVGIFLFSSTAVGTILILPIYFQQQGGLSAMQTGFTLLPSVIAMAIGMALSGLLCKDDYLEPTVIAGGLITIFGLIWTSEDVWFHNGETLYWPLIIRSVGLGLAFVPLSNICLTRIPEMKLTDGSALFNIMRQFGGAIGIAIASQLLSIANLRILETNISQTGVFALAILCYVPVIMTAIVLLLLL